MNKPSWIRQHVGIVDELKVAGALEYMGQVPHPWAIARRKVTKAKNALTRIRAEIYGEQTGTRDDKDAATERHPRVIAARDAIAEAEFEVDTHSCRREHHKSQIDVFQTESANTRSVGNLR